MSLSGSLLGYERASFGEGLDENDEAYEGEGDENNSYVSTGFPSNFERWSTIYLDTFWV